ncbi:BatD family protein [Luteirhabdus pelagi]|uniref:BatD family protein n=1 Tax=Luteirhabdus pelagi TaxID=2792783 RepID=UPI00193A4D06|nr:BatD family protein [Luteirhabdus pelagi]
MKWSRLLHLKLMVFIVALCAIHTTSVAQQVTASLDTTTIRIGEEIRYSMEVVADSTDLIVFPDGQTFSPLEVIESYKIDTTFEQAKYRLIKKYGLTQFDSGSYTIPPQRVMYNDKALVTDSFQVEVRNVPVDTTQQRMFDIKPAMEVKRPPFNWIALLLWLVPLLIIGAGLFWYFRRKKRKEEAEQQLPPYEEAITALHELDNSPYLKERKSKEYYSHLTEIVKRYLDREVDDIALEATTGELISRLQMHKDAGHFDFDTNTLRKLEEILRRADLVKFAKMEQAEGQAISDRKSIEEIINETEEAIPEPTEEELQADLEYQEAQRRKRQRRKWIYAGVGVLVAIVLAGAIYGSLTGFDNLRDKVFGNEMRELAEGRWYKSEYGSPQIIIETPEILVRKVDSTGKGTTFETGALTEPFYISVSTVSLQVEQKVGLEQAMDVALETLEERGATNLLVKREAFETQKGITGLKAFGKLNVKVSEDKILNVDSHYELLLFAQPGYLQQILLVYQDDGKYAEGIQERILNSVELEVPASSQTVTQ